MRVLEARLQDLRKIMQEIRVDSYGIDIMYPKALSYLVKINQISNITANILKQEMLSLGADAAIARGALTGETKKTDCLLMGTLSQFNRLSRKLRLQPFNLDKLSQELRLAMENYKREKFVLALGSHRLRLGRRTQIMGIVNLTDDSFSGDGLYKTCDLPAACGLRPATLEYIVEYAERLVKDGADIIDIGAESSRPGARPVSAKEELERAVPVIKRLVKKIKVPLSVDTCKPEVAKAALDCGVSIVNDITGLRDKKMARLIAGYKCGVVIMHMKGRPQNMQKNPVYRSLIDEIMDFFHKSINSALDVGIEREKIIIDPGIGFGKTMEHNLTILKSLREFKVLGRPILVGPSRKSFIGKILNAAPDKRICGTLSSSVLAALNGADIIRVHDVKEVRQALKVMEAIIRA
jgi:dihydropteroate synthase